MKMSQIYADAVYDNLRPLFANWEPMRPVELGDFGLMDSKSFLHLGNISTYNIPFTVRSSPTKDHKSFASRGSVSISTHAKGSFPINGIVNAKATLEINFSKDEAVFFNAADCSYQMIDNKVALGEQIMKRFNVGDWKRGWVVVTDLIQAGSTTVAISGANNSKLLLEAAGNVEQIDLASASVGLNVKTSTNVGYQIISKAGLVPLIGLCKIRSRFRIFNTFTPHVGLSRIDDFLTSPGTTREISTEEFYFGQLD